MEASNILDEPSAFIHNLLTKTICKKVLNMFTTNAFAIASGSAYPFPAPDRTVSDPASYRFMSIHDENNAWMHQYIPKEEYDAAVRAVAAIFAVPVPTPRLS